MNIETIPVTTPSLQLPSAGSTSITPVPDESDHRGNGKIAQLPKVLRDQVNRMLDDGVPYKAIIEKLEQSTDPPLPYKILEMNISRWKDNGYQKYLRHQEWRDQLRILRENGSDMSELTDGPKFQETLVQIALTEIFRVLQQGELKPDSLNYIRLFNALARLNREALGLRKYNDQQAKEQAQLKQLDINREFAENEHLAIVDRTDRIMEMPRPRRAEGSPARAASGANIPTGPRDVPARSSVSPQGVSPSTGSTLPPRSVCGSRGDEAQTNDQPAVSESGDTDPVSQPENFPSHASRITHHAAESSIQNPASAPEHCLDCRHPLPPLTPEGKRPDERCENCNILLPPPGTCTRPSSEKCHFCGVTLPRRLPNGRRPRPTCHNCGTHLGRELED